jgi:hypothetical protein
MLEHVGILNDNRHDLDVVDRGHRALKTRLLISGKLRGLTPKLTAGEGLCSAL